MFRYHKNIFQRKSREIRKHTELTENENTTYQNLLDTIKAVLHGKLEH